MISLNSHRFGVPWWLLSWLAFSLINYFPVLGQEFSTYEYHIKDGLPTDVIKDVEEDSLGFLWVATDEGLVRFDGSEFRLFKNALRSQYAKCFLKRKTGELYLIGDLDLVEIVNRVDTVEFRRILSATRNPTDSTLWYPKSIYEDSKGRLWFGETQSVALLNGDHFQRFMFNERDKTPSFTRSFTFFEDPAGNLYTISYPGRVFKYNTDQSSFQLITTLPTVVNDIEVQDDLLWIAGGSGLYRSIIHVGYIEKPTKLSSVQNLSGICSLPDGRLLITTFGKDQYILPAHTETLQLFHNNINDVNRAHVTVDGDLFICSSEGLFLFQLNLFRGLSTDAGLTRFIQSITENEAGTTIYFATAERLYKVEKQNGRAVRTIVIDYQPGQYFQSLVFSGQRLWASNSNRILVYENDVVVKTYDFSNEGRTVFDLMSDDSGNVWASQDGNEQAICISPDGTISRIPVPMSKEASLNTIRETSNGLYAGSSGINSYLFFKGHTDSVFTNVSVVPPFDPEGDFSIVDIIEIGDAIWLASSEGLLRFDGTRIDRVSLGDAMTTQPVKVLSDISSGQLLLGSSLGLHRYDLASGEWWVYNESSGLPTNSVYARGILRASDETLWIGTAKGIAYNVRSVDAGQHTRTPWITQLLIDGVSVKMDDKVAVAYGSYLELALSTNIFPSAAATLQYQTSRDTTWRRVNNNRVTFSELSPGPVDVRFRAKKSGGYDWSPVRSIELYVRNPFWQELWFQILVAGILFAVAWTSYVLTRSLARKRREKLEKLYLEVNEQREELQAQAEELREANDSLSMLSQDLTEKNKEIENLNNQLKEKVLEKGKDLLEANEILSKNNSDLLQFSYSISHNLRGPVARLLGLTLLLDKTEVPIEARELFDMIRTSAHELDVVLKDLSGILELRRNVLHVQDKVHFQVEWNRCLSLLKDQVRDDFGIRAEFADAPYIYCVRGLLQSIMYNLLSNALKYRSPHRPLVVTAKSHREGNRTFFTISDNGLGFDTTGQATNLFKLYKRFHTHVPGRGIGLYLVKAQTEIMNGQIEVESHLNEGTTFRLCIPDPEIIEQDVFFENDTAALSYDVNANCTILKWKSMVTSASYRAVFEKILDNIQKYNSPGWIADLRNQGVVPVEDQVWFASTILPMAVAHGLTRIASIGFNDPEKAIYYERMKQRAKDLGFEIRDFDELEPALDWMTRGHQEKINNSR